MTVAKFIKELQKVKDQTVQVLVSVDHFISDETGYETQNHPAKIYDLETRVIINSEW